MGEQEKFSDIIYNKEHEENDIYIKIETLIGYNDDSIIFIMDRGNYYGERLISSESIQKFDREDSKKPITMFFIGDTIGFVDGKKVRISDENGKLSTFEIEEDIQRVEIKNGYVLINNDIICCGARYNESTFSSDKNIEPFCKRIKNIDYFEQYIQQNNKIYQKNFIENENGCFFEEGLSEEERLKLYKEQGFTELYEKLEAKIIERNNKEKEKQEAKLKNDEKLYKIIEPIHSLLVPVVFRNPDESHTMDGASIYLGENNVKTHTIYYDDNPKIQALYGVQEPGWSYSGYRGLVINVEMAKKIVRNGKLHLDVPEEAMGMIIGRKGSNINFVTKRLMEKGVDVSKIILHPKSKEEMQIRLENIEKAIQEQKDKVL